MAAPPSANAASRSHLVLIPTFNNGPRAVETVREARRFWAPVWVVVDGSTDGSAQALQAFAAGDFETKVLVLARNRGKGAAVLHGAREAAARGFTHVLVMDADGQHPADRIRAFMTASQADPDAQILGVPVFDASAPAARVYGRKLCNAFAHLETLWAGIGDSLYGFRVYPIAPLIAVAGNRKSMQGFDFEPEAAVRLCWRGVPPVNLPAPVRYFRREEGGVSHFRYVRDNALLVWMHLRLIAAFVPRLPRSCGGDSSRTKIRHD